MREITKLIQEGRVQEAERVLSARLHTLMENTFGTEADLTRDLGHINPEADVIHTLSLSDTRKPVLTLMMLNRMNKIRSTKKLEMAQKSDVLQLIFGDTEEPGM